MEIANDIEIVNSWPALYLRDIDALVLADLHLGYEVVKAERDGVAIPKTQGKQLLEMMRKILAAQKAKTIIVLGDIKHEFSETSYHEYKEVLNFLEFLSKSFKRVILIKGNHDNFLIRAARKFENVELCDNLRIKDFYFMHGHQEIQLRKIKQRNVIIAHEHPAIALYDELRIKEKVKCFLYGKISGKFVIVMPAISIFAAGSDVNVMGAEELLSPLLKKEGVDRFKAIGVIEGDELLKFPEIRKLKKI